MKEFCYLSTEEKNIISNTIISAMLNDVKEVYIENNLHHRNAYSMLVWDFVGSKVIETLKNTRLKVIKTKRGRFSFDLILDEEYHTIYSIMKKSNIEKVKKERKFSHYLWALTSINCDIEVGEGQLNLFTIESNNEYREKTKKELLTGVEAIVNRYCIIVINDDNKQFPSIQLGVYDMNLNCIYEEMWKESIIIDYNFENDDNSNEDKPIIKIKDDFEENILKIKKQEEKKEEKEG